MIVGEAAVSHGAAWSKQIGRDVIALAAQAATMSPNIAEGWNGFALLHHAAGRVGGIDIGFVPHNGGVCSADQVKLAGQGTLDVLFLLGADEYDTTAMGKAFVVYIGTHGDAGAHRADVILPAAAYTEKSATYVNTEGRVQQTERAVFPPGDAKEDWSIFRALSGVLGMPLPFNSLAGLRKNLYAEFPHLAAARSSRGRRSAGPQGARQDLGQDHFGAADDAGRRRLLPFEPDRAVVRGDGGMRATRCRLPAGSGVGTVMEFIGTAAGLPARAELHRARDADRLRLEGAGLPRRAADLHRLHPARRPQDLGRGADPPRPQRGRRLRPAAVASRTSSSSCSRSR